MFASGKLNIILVMNMALVFLMAGGCAKQDLYDPPGAAVTRMGTLALPSINEGVAVIGRYAFVAGGQAGLHAIDFSDPAHPILTQTINTLKYSESVEVVRTFVNGSVQDVALVVEGTEGVTSYDITDPANMTSFNTTTTAVFGNRIFVEQNEDPQEPYNVYMAEGWKGLRIFESIPSQPGILSYNGVFSPTNGYGEGVFVQDGYCYMADDEMGLAVLDVRVLELGSVELVSWCDTPGEALDVVLDGQYAFVADGNEGMAIFSIDGGETPVLVAQFPLEGKSRAIDVRDGVAILASQSSGVNFVDIKDPRNPIFLGRIDTEYAMDLALSSEGYILVVDREEGLIIFQSNEPFIDTTPPGKIFNLTAEPFGAQTIRLQWFMTGDDGLFGLAAGTEVRMADTLIENETDWNAATVVSGIPEPDVPGTHQTHILTNIPGEQLRYFAIKTSDENGTESAISNIASSTPGLGILLFDASLDIHGGTTTDTYTYQISYIFDEEPTIHQVIIDGTAYDMAAIAAKEGETVYQYQMQLDRGQHDFSFSFDAPSAQPTATATKLGPAVGHYVFTMGSSEEDEPGYLSDEWQHTVVFSHNVQAQVHEVTQSQWQDLALNNPSHFSGADKPVENITWFLAVLACNRQSAEDGFDPVYDIDDVTVAWDQEADGWRLPTEAEWEWLCRAGSTTTFPGGDMTAWSCNVDPILNPMAWYCGSFTAMDPATQDVGQKDANAGGLYDIGGNVWEWCWDWYGDYRILDADADNVVLDPIGPSAGTQRIIRGGSWYTGSETCRSANRSMRYPDTADNTVGLRMVRTIFED